MGAGSLPPAPINPPDIHMVQVKAVQPDGDHVIGAERGYRALLPFVERHRGEEPPLGIEDLPPVPGRPDDFDP